MAETANAAALVGGVGMGMMDREGKYPTFALKGGKGAFAVDRPSF